MCYSYYQAVWESLGGTHHDAILPWIIDEGIYIERKLGKLKVVYADHSPNPLLRNI